MLNKTKHIGKRYTYLAPLPVPIFCCSTKPSWNKHFKSFRSVVNSVVVSQLIVFVCSIGCSFVVFRM